MKRIIVLGSVVVETLILAGVSSRLSGQEMAKPKSNPGFEQLKSLSGEWTGTNADGKPVDVAYQVVSNGSALMERLHPAVEAEMITMYAPDGARVAATHYCNVGNQPEMQTEPLSGTPQKFDFHFVRVTNLASPGAGHMEKLVVTIQDHDHFLQEWSFVENGKVTHTQVLHFTRKS